MRLCKAIKIYPFPNARMNLHLSKHDFCLTFSSQACAKDLRAVWRCGPKDAPSGTSSQDVIQGCPDGAAV